MGVGGNIAASVLGNPKKAFLVIHKERAQSSASVAALAEKALQLSVDADGKALSTIFGGAGKSHVLQVQYNPSSIGFQANATPTPVNRLQQNVVAEIPPQFNRPPSVVMSLQLVFDAVNVKDSFMADKFRLSASDAVTAGAAIVNREKYTVQAQTNALLAMLLRKESSLVTFHWANMTFCGQVSEAQARYVMFSVSGRPVRSLVQLSILQSVEEASDVKYWEKAFNKCFGNVNEMGDFGGQLVGQNVGNMLNLGF